MVQNAARPWPEATRLRVKVADEILHLAVRRNEQHPFNAKFEKIRTLDELSQAFAQAPERLVIRMIGDGPPLVLDRNKVEAARERIKARYNVLKEQNLEERLASSIATAEDKN